MCRFKFFKVVWMLLETVNTILEGLQLTELITQQDREYLCILYAIRAAWLLYRLQAKLNSGEPLV
jgi:hypothetical protein